LDIDSRASSATPRSKDVVPVIRFSKSAVVSALVGGAAALTLIAAPAAAAATSPAAGQPAVAQPAVGQPAVGQPAADQPADAANHFSDGVQKVIDQVHQQYPNAYLVEGDGVSPTGPTNDVANVTSWRFVFDDTQDANHPFTIFAQVDLPSWNATITTHSSVWVGSLQLTQPVTMTPAHAAELLRQAGYDGNFTYVTLRQPIAGGFTPHPLFIFSEVGPTGHVGVDTVTGDVAPIK
jgi:hypothetical protein